MQNFFESGRVPTEKRRGDRKKQKFAAQRQSVHSFLKSLNCVEAHYCRGSSQQRKYRPSELKLKNYINFLNKHIQTAQSNHLTLDLSLIRILILVLGVQGRMCARNALNFKKNLKSKMIHRRKTY